LRQYDRYNASEFEDAATQELLGALLDAIELRARIKEQGSAGTR
jgi:hypothetical protein